MSSIALRQRPTSGALSTFQNVRSWFAFEPPPAAYRGEWISTPQVSSMDALDGDALDH